VCSKPWSDTIGHPRPGARGAQPAEGITRVHLLVWKPHGKRSLRPRLTTCRVTPSPGKIPPFSGLPPRPVARRPKALRRSRTMAEGEGRSGRGGGRRVKRGKMGRPGECSCGPRPRALECCEPWNPAHAGVRYPGGVGETRSGNAGFVLACADEAYLIFAGFTSFGVVGRSDRPHIVRLRRSFRPVADRRPPVNRSHQPAKGAGSHPA
jgi:hypothetical protein